MKKFTTLLAILSLIASVNLMAQEVNLNVNADQEKKNKSHNFWYGFKVGTDLATPTIDEEVIKAQIKCNYQVGMFFQFGRKIYLQPEFYYAVRNVNQELTFNSMPEDLKVNSIKVPVLIGIKIIDLKIISAHLMGGPMGTFDLDEGKIESKNILKNIDYKLQLGAGVDVLGFITLDVRYAVNLNEDLKSELNNLNWKSGVNVTLGLKLR